MPQNPDGLTALVKAFVDGAEAWGKAVALLSALFAGAVAYFRRRGWWPFRPLLPKLIRKELARVIMETKLMNKETRYRVTFKSVMNGQLRLTVDFTQRTLNTTRKSRTFRSVFPTGFREYQLNSLELDGSQFRPSKEDENGFEFEKLIAPQKEVCVFASWDVTYRQRDSELLVAYAPGDKFVVELIDLVSEQQGGDYFVIEKELLVDRSKVASEGRLDGRPFTWRIEISDGHLPFSGVNLKWRPKLPAVD